jgi:predicted nucleic acid-binding protein
LRRLGVTVRKTIDLLIGTHCITDDCALLHSDRDFDPMTRHLGLRAL